MAQSGQIQSGDDIISAGGAEGKKPPPGFSHFHITTTHLPNACNKLFLLHT
jgi:hypothetical protein